VVRRRLCQRWTKVYAYPGSILLPLRVLSILHCGGGVKHAERSEVLHIVFVIAGPDPRLMTPVPKDFHVLVSQLSFTAPSPVAVITDEWITQWKAAQRTYFLFFFGVHFLFFGIHSSLSFESPCPYPQHFRTEIAKTTRGTLLA